MHSKLNIAVDSIEHLRSLRASIEMNKNEKQMFDNNVNMLLRRCVHIFDAILVFFALILLLNGEW